MKKRILSIILAAAVLILSLPIVANAADIAWTGGDSNHGHIIDSTTYTYLNTSEHEASLNCKCGAKSTWTESHYDVKSSEIEPDSQYPNGAKLFFCPHCQKE